MIRTNIINYIILFCFVQIFISCYSTRNDRIYPYYDKQTEFSKNSSNAPMPVVPGKCFAKSMIPNKYEIVSQDLIVYTGEDLNAESVSLEKIVLKPAITKWEKRIRDNCVSVDPKDCLVWCLVNIPEEAKEVYIVTDTLMEKSYEIQQFQQEVLVRSGGYTEWKEVICQEDLTTNLVLKIQNALITKGFGKTVIPSGDLNREWKTILVDYQKKQFLPVGNVNVETLDHLGVEY